MKSLLKKNYRFVWLAVCIAVLGIITAGYFVFQSNVESNQSIAAQLKSIDANTRTEITTGDSEFGSMLFNKSGQAIYIWEVEKSAAAECYGSCANAWPPVLTGGAPMASGGVNSELLGTIKRTDGTTQVTYNGHPLYYYAHEKAGEVRCHNKSTHGGLWWVIQPNGERAK